MGSILGEPPDDPVVLDAPAPATNASTAIALARLGLKVLPVWPPTPWSVKDATDCTCPLGAECGSPGKHPRSEPGFFPHGLNQATSVEDTIRQAWDLHPEASVAVAMRESNLVALDVDSYHGDEEKLALLEKLFGPLPTSLEQMSGSREGRHLIFAVPTEADGSPMRCRGVLGGVVVRARAYIVVSPSRHAHGSHYEWVAGRGPTDGVLAALPEAWIAALRPDKVEGAVGAPAPADEAPWLSALPPAAREAAAVEHLKAEKGEVKGRDKAGTTFDVVRSVARGFALRDPDLVARLVIDIYNPKCSPPWDHDKIERLAWNALNRAHSPDWGTHLRPADVELADTLAELGATDAPVWPDDAPRAVELGAPTVLGPAVAAPVEAVSRGMLDAEMRAAQRRLARSSNSSHVRDGELMKRAIRGQPLADHSEERGEALNLLLRAIARHAPPGVSADHVGELVMASAPNMSPVEIAAAFEEARRTTRPAPRARGAGEVPVELPDPQDDDEVRTRLQPGPNGEGVRGSGPNVEMILRFGSDTRDQIRFNMLTKVLEISGGPLKEFPADVLDVAVKNYLGRKWLLHCSTSEVAEQIGMVSRTHWQYDPVAEYLREDIRWDGVPRIGGDSVSWLTTYCGVKDTPYARKVGARFLISAAARALDPGCKVDTVLVLEGLQGARKSQMLGALGGQWFTDTPINIGDKDSRMLAASTWIVELAELSSLSAGEVESHKAFLSSSADHFRPPYGRTIVSYPRRCVFAGSTNAEEYLRDATGNRRFWAVRVGECRPDLLRDVRDQLWAEAVARYDMASRADWARGLSADPKNPAGERWWFEREEEAEAAAEIESRSVEDPWVPLIIQWVDANGRPGAGAGTGTHAFTLAEIAEGALNMAFADLPRHQAKIAAAMRAAGLSSRRASNGRRHRVWFKPPPGEAPTHTGAVSEHEERKHAGTN